MFKAEGLITPVVTALTETEEFNKEYQSFYRPFDSSRCPWDFPLGTNGEFYTFSAKRKTEIIEATVEAVQGRVPVYARRERYDERND